MEQPNNNADLVNILRFFAKSVTNETTTDASI
jgi:hypothetical protein